MSYEREKRKRNLLLKREVQKGRFKIKKFLENKTSFNGYIEDKISKLGNKIAITDTYNDISMTYDEVNEAMTNFASALQSLGVKKGDFVSIFTENHGRWAICDQGAMRCGAVCVLRGSNAPVTELSFILSHSNSVGVILRDSNLFNKIKPYLNEKNLKFVILMFKNKDIDITDLNCPVYSYDEIIEMGKNNEFHNVEQNLDEYCAMLYTSGTTGNPKGIAISHKNLLSQLPPFDYALQPPKEGENTLHILPVWHAYEHITQLYFLTLGNHLYFSTLQGLKNDLAKYPIGLMLSVPRIWEALRLGLYQKLKQNSPMLYWLFDIAVKISINYRIHKMYSEKRITNKKNRYHKTVRLYHKIVRSFLKPVHVFFYNTLYKKIKNMIGLNFRLIISGGGALSMKDQLFYDAIGVNLREGYGLTETSPVLSVRNVLDPNFLGCCGTPFMGLEMEIRDIETGEKLDIFKKGVVFVRGYQVTDGYYHDKEATAKVFSEDGWFNTGDIGWLTGNNNLVLVGRMKETIVLSNGENVEPVPIEEACLESPYIDQIVLVGQDQTSIGALIVPSEEALKKCNLLAKDMKSGSTLSIKDATLHELIKKEIAIHIKEKKNLKNFEQIKQFEVIKENFTMENGLMSHTAKLKRNNIFDKYKETINSMFKK